MRARSLVHGSSTKKTLTCTETSWTTQYLCGIVSLRWNGLARSVTGAARAVTVTYRPAYQRSLRMWGSLLVAVFGSATGGEDRPRRVFLRHGRTAVA
jgi:hypothetical protein